MTAYEAAILIHAHVATAIFSVVNAALRAAGVIG